MTDHRMVSTRGELVIASCTAARYLSDSIAARLEQEQTTDNTNPAVYLPDIDFRFSDTEAGVRLERDVSGADVFLIQTLYDPRNGTAVNETYLTLCIAARAFREWGAHKITAVLPYLPYSRQDKPTRFQREPTTAKLMADLTITAGVDRLITWHPHYAQIRGFYSGVPVNVIDPLITMADLLDSYQGREDVILVAPDVGASKLVTHLGRHLNLQVAIAAKYHPGHEQVEISQIIGDLSDKRTAIVIDDIMSSGSTVAGVVKMLVTQHQIERVILLISHNLCTAAAYEHLLNLHEDFQLIQCHITNSIPQTEAFADLPFVQVHDLTGLLTTEIQKIHHNR